MEIEKVGKIIGQLVEGEVGKDGNVVMRKPPNPPERCPRCGSGSLRKEERAMRS